MKVAVAAVRAVVESEAAITAAEGTTREAEVAGVFCCCRNCCSYWCYGRYTCCYYRSIWSETASAVAAAVFVFADRGRAAAVVTDLLTRLADRGWVRVLRGSQSLHRLLTMSEALLLKLS
ncbi:hypothetical protein MLD38_022328 [Melastoma candidum]|uniref:Uncharacterized protein n=1 Tax=Melastoma candidum TaxID=119954 RepID=A0ACB9QJX9_9MYRT|nr:hypothetical protein MLD38_022328 [Melastoma candidum]